MRSIIVLLLSGCLLVAQFILITLSTAASWFTCLFFPILGLILFCVGYLVAKGLVLQHIETFEQHLEPYIGPQLATITTDGIKSALLH